MRIAVAVLALCIATPAGAVDVTFCGQTFEKSGALTADLDCSGFPGAAVSGSGDFDLAGFTLTGGDGRAFNCTNARCDVFSSLPGGEIVGAASRVEDCVAEVNGGRLNVRDIWIRQCDVAVLGATVSLENVTITDSTTGLSVFAFNGGTFERSHGTVVNSSITADESGLRGDLTTFTVTDSTISGASIAGIDNLFRGVVKATNSTITGSYAGVVAMNCAFTDTTIDGNTEYGAACYDRIRMTGGSASSNGGHGLRAFYRLKVVQADVSGNAGTGIFGGFANSLTEGVAGAIVTVKQSTVTGNGVDGVYGVRLKIKQTLIDGNSRYGARASGRDPDVFSLATKNGSLRISESTVTGNGEFGVVADANVGEQPPLCLYKVAAKLRASTVAGNGTDVDCGIGTECADVGSCVLPKLGGDATCDTSHQIGSGIPGSDWDVCTLD